MNHDIWDESFTETEPTSKMVSHAMKNFLRHLPRNSSALSLSVPLFRWRSSFVHNQHWRYQVRCRITSVNIWLLYLKSYPPKVAPLPSHPFPIYSEVFPDGWKRAPIQPIPKNGSKSLQPNSIPISISS